MQIRTTARHFDLTDDLRNFAEGHIQKLEKYFNQIIDSHLILETEKSRMTAELKLKVYGTVLTSKHKSFDMYDSVEKVIGKMEVQLKRYKGKLKDKKVKNSRKTSQITREAEESNAQEEFEEV